MEKLAIVIVTFKRQALLDKLLESILLSDRAPWRVFIVDNENSEETSCIIDVYKQLIDEKLTACEWPEGSKTLVYVPMSTNTGGAGGFSQGVISAYNEGAEWFWLMDDDVVIMPDAIEKLDKWCNEFDVIQGSRLDFDGGPFYWQYQFIEPMAMYNPLAPSKPTGTGWKKTNTMCFEGGLFNRKVVEQIGPPDPRFFIYWDDCIYGYLASKVGKSAVVDDIVLQRTRDIPNWEVSGVRQLNSSSNMTRYHIMRNRGFMAHYLKLNGDYNPVMFGAGTAACFAKEVIRLASVDRKDLVPGLRNLAKGWVDARKVMADNGWKAMSPEDLVV